MLYDPVKAKILLQKLHNSRCKEMITQEKNLLELLSNQDVTFFIPPYQRNYEWTKEECEVFWKDILKTYKNNHEGKSTEHFFGTITYFQNETAFGQPNKLVLIDGQQRITTTLLFLIALRDIVDDDTMETFIENKYLKNVSASDDSEYKIKLKQVETDWEVYKNLILAETINEREEDSPIYKNYNYFIQNLGGVAEKDYNLKELVEKGISKFNVITIELQPNKNEWENPQEIFESMNSLGKPLSLADLVRNYLLLGLKPERQEELYRKYWLHIENTIPSKVSDFIRDYMQLEMKSSYPKASETNYKMLYGKFKELFDGKNTETILGELSEYSDTYSFIVSEQTSGNKEVDRLLSDLRRINVTTAYSFLLALLYAWKCGSFSDKEIIDVLEAFKVYCFRRRILGLTQAENKVFPTLAAKVDDLIRSRDKKQSMFNILSSQENRLRLPNDIEMKRYMQTMNFYNFKNCKLILSMVEEKITKSRPGLNDSKLQVEHIMPQTLSEEWKADLGENYDSIYQTYVHNIGNLTLIRHNQELGQKPFDEKLQVFENKAGLQIARTHITDKKKWSEEEICERMDWIIGYILQEVLPIPDSKRKTNNYVAKKSGRLSFQDLQLIGSEIHFIEDPTIVAKVISDTQVEFEGKKWKLSALTRELKTRNGTVSSSGAYRGAVYWTYEGLPLIEFCK